MKNPQLNKLILEFSSQLIELKEKCSKLDHSEQAKQTEFIHQCKEQLFKINDHYFGEIWNYLTKLDEAEYINSQKQIIEVLDPLLREDLEIVTYIRARPLGYAGDFVTMNYIYDYSSSHFIGKTVYEKLLNHYTCTIKVSRSNIARKDYLKRTITKEVSSRANSKILSVGCGPARELIELLNEKKLKNNAHFICLDFEKHAISYIQNELTKVTYGKNITIDLHQKNLLDLIKNNQLGDYQGSNLIYISGVFDYFTDRLCKKTIKNLYPLLAPGGQMIVFNMSLENQSHRAYYETFARWEMKHRTEDQVKKWIDGDMDQCTFYIDRVKDCPSYHILKIVKG